VEIPQELPEWLDNGAWRYKVRWHSTNTPVGFVQTTDQPGVTFRSSLFTSAGFGVSFTAGTIIPYPGYSVGRALGRFVDNSTNRPFFVTDDRFGQANGRLSGGTIYHDRTGWVKDFFNGSSVYDVSGDNNAAFHYCSEPITKYDGGTRYKKNLVVWTARKGERLDVGRTILYTSGGVPQPSAAPWGYWTNDCLFLARIDYDPSVIDFDQELINGKLFVS
jgi:hypothetical protein